MNITKNGTFATIMALLLMISSQSIKPGVSKSNYLSAKDYHLRNIANKQPLDIIAAIPTRSTALQNTAATYGFLKSALNDAIDRGYTDGSFYPLEETEKLSLMTDIDLHKAINKLAQNIHQLLLDFVTPSRVDEVD